VITGIENDDGHGYHAWVIVERLDSGEYRAVSKGMSDTIELRDVKARITRMMGSDIETYRINN